MRLLADENIPRDTVLVLRALGHDVSWVSETGPGDTDDTLIAIAEQERRLILTHDKDFGELVFSRKLQLTTGVILLRVIERNASAVSEVVARALESQSGWEGWFSVVEPTGIRMARLPRAP